MKPIDNAQSLNLQNQRLWLLPEKVVYWQKNRILLLADLHLGKAGHFRKNGIPVPSNVNTTNLRVLDDVLGKIQVEHLVILGDLFHSSANREWDQFLEWRSRYPDMEISLVIGNHDILSQRSYHATHLNLFRKLRIDPFLLVHDYSQYNRQKRDNHYLLSGHVHPAVQLRGKGRQSMKLPCFYFGARMGILPAFGAFTGTHVIKPATDDRVFAVADDRVLNLRVYNNS